LCVARRSFGPHRTLAEGGRQSGRPPSQRARQVFPSVVVALPSVADDSLLQGIVARNKIKLCRSDFLILLSLLICCRSFVWHPIVSFQDFSDDSTGISTNIFALNLLAARLRLVHA